jgi:hypothetical protein
MEQVKAIAQIRLSAEYKQKAIPMNRDGFLNEFTL